MKTLAVLLASLALWLPPQEKPKKRALADRAEIQGTLVCVGCHLENEVGAESQCTLHSRHAQGLLAGDGLVFTLLDNAKGHLVRTNEKLRGRNLKLFGWRYPKTQIIEVSKYQVKEGDAWVAYDYCKTCGFEKGDNQDTDLCEDCRAP